MRWYYLLLDTPEKLPKNTEYVSEDFYTDYNMYYSPRYYTRFESIFIDFIYQIILESHLIKDNRMANFERQVIKTETVIEDLALVDIKKEETQKCTKYHEYMQNDYRERCRAAAKDIYQMLKDKEIIMLDLIERFKETETEFEFVQNINPYMCTLEKFVNYLEYDTENNVKVIYSSKDIGDWLSYHNVRHVLF